MIIITVRCLTSALIREILLQLVTFKSRFLKVFLWIVGHLSTWRKLLWITPFWQPPICKSHMFFFFKLSTRRQNKHCKSFCTKTEKQQQLYLQVDWMKTLLPELLYNLDIYIKKNPQLTRSWYHLGIHWWWRPRFRNSRSWEETRIWNCNIAKWQSFVNYFSRVTHEVLWRRKPDQVLLKSPKSRKMAVKNF